MRIFQYFTDIFIFLQAPVNVPILACLMCVVLMASAETKTFPQLPFYAPRPWWHGLGPQDPNGSGGDGLVTSTPTSSSESFGSGRFLTVFDDSVSFRFYNNVPIQGPDTPCIGCTFMLTKNGFVKKG
jgi:hypothetical protein